MLNDAVSIVLFKSFLSYSDAESFNAGQLFEVIGKFLGISIGSILIGVLCGLSCSLLCKHTLIRYEHGYEVIILLVTMYCAFSIPFRVGFDSMAVDGWLMFETVVDISFLMDIVVNFRTGYCLDEDNEDSRIELRPKEIAKHYMKGWFVIDIVSAFPSQFLTMASGSEGESTAVNKLPRLMRIPRVVRYAPAPTDHRSALLCLGPIPC